MRSGVWLVLTAAFASGCVHTEGTFATIYEGDVEVELNNESGERICFVFITPSDHTEWGDDWTRRYETIRDGSSRTFDVRPGHYDVLLIACDLDRRNRNRGPRVLVLERDVDFQVAVELLVYDGPADEIEERPGLLAIPASPRHVGLEAEEVLRDRAAPDLRR